MINTILIPLDGSPLSEQGMHTACATARETGASLLLLTATSFSFLADADDREKELLVLRERQQYLRETCRSLESRGFTARAVVMPGDAVSAILFTAEAERIGLISLTVHVHTGLRHALLGSTADLVARESTLPLLLTPANSRPSQEEVTAHHRILVPLDGTPFAETALSFLSAHQIGQVGELLALRVVTSEPTLPLPIGLAGNETAVVYLDTHEQIERRRQEAAEYLRILGAAQPPDRIWKPMVVQADPATAILEAARANQADLIVLTTHARRGLDRLVHGSVAHEVLKHAEVPVLLLRYPAEEGEAGEPDRAVARPVQEEAVNA